jgi:sec-independent protein translocase protein TatB
MNIFSNIGITELIIILLLALLVVGPERLPELGQKLGKVLRDVRKAYENLTQDLGPELASLQQTTQELRKSVESVTSIPQDMVQTVVKAADLEDTIGELKGIQDSVGQLSQTVTAAGKIVKDPIGAAVDTAKGALLPTQPEEAKKAAEVADSIPGGESTDHTVEPVATQAEATGTADAGQEDGTASESADSTPEEQARE